MVRSCSVFGCHNKDTKGSGFRFFRLPRVVTNSDLATRELSGRRRREWLAAICRKDMNPDTCLVCSCHFISGKKLVGNLLESLSTVSGRIPNRAKLRKAIQM